MKKTNGRKPHHAITGTYPNRGTQAERLASAHHDVAVLLANARAVPCEEPDAGAARGELSCLGWAA